MDAETILKVPGTDASWYALCDRGNGTACVYVLCVVDDVNATGIQSMIDAHGGTIPGAVVEGTLPDYQDPDYLPNHQALIWDIQQMPRVIEDPILAYTSDGEINQIQWASTQPDWIAICYNNCLEILRV